MGNCCNSAKKSAVLPEPPKQEYPLLDEESDSDDSDDGETQTLMLEGEQLTSVTEEWKDAVESRNNQKLKQLFQQYNQRVDFLSIIFENGDNSLHHAARKGNVKLAKFLILVGIDIDGLNEVSGNTALHYAVLETNVSMVRLLIENDCNPDITNKYNSYPNDIAAAKSNDTIIDLLAGAEIHTLGLNPNNKSAHLEHYTASVLKLSGIGSNGDANSLGVHKANPRPTMVALHALTDDTKALPVLQGFLDKKTGKAPYNYHRRWVIVARPYILWDCSEKDIIDGNDHEERNKFSHFISMLAVEDVTKKQSHGTAQTKFIINARDMHATKKQYVFRCPNEQIRDEWVVGLNKYLKYFREMQDLLS